ncbi:MAG: hypothetical protein ABI376_06680 [Caulobacteraceae bacterium]
MSASATLIALALLATTPAPEAPGEPLPPGAPTEDYPLTAWCYGALSEYLVVYDQVKPDLVAIDKAYGKSVKNEPAPYYSDMQAARAEAKVLAGAVEAAEKASPTPIAAKGAEAIRQGQAIWHPAEEKPRRALARAWLSWALPDRCDTTARGLAARSALLGKALKYNDAAPAAPTPPENPAARAPEAPATQPPTP